MQVFLVAGSPTGQRPYGVSPKPGDMVIAVDFGAHHATKWGWPIDLLIGDLDSLAPAEAAALENAGTRIVTAPRAKDETDLELGLDEALRVEPQEIIICAALGARVDHLLANILLLARPELANVDVRIVGGAENLRLLRAAGGEPAELILDGAQGDLLSLLPLDENVKGVHTNGLVYPLRGESLRFGRARGISNLFATASPSVSLQSGHLLVIHTRQAKG